MIFAVYDKATHAILRFGDCAANAFAAQATADHEAVAALDAALDPRRSYRLMDKEKPADIGPSPLARVLEARTR